MAYKILVIDDDHLNLKVIRIYLIQKGFEVIKALNGEEGINKAIRIKPDLILLDVLMPGMDGFKVCNLLKENTETKKIPVIFLTALVNTSSIKHAFEAGAVDYVTKPIVFDVLLARINTHIRLSDMTCDLELQVEEKTSRLAEANKALKMLLQDKEILLKELYHRTKNNMQVISSMLSLHSNFSESDDVSKILMEIENKVQSMALVHTRLYQSDNLSSLSLNGYLEDLVEIIHTSYNINPDQVHFVFDFDEITVLIDTAVSCGLIINELLSNSFKYAFPDNRKGIINIVLKKIGSSEIFLKIKDDGIGISDNYDFQNSNTLGVQTVMGIGKQQLQGEVVFIVDNGFSCELKFPDNIYSNRI